MSWCPVSRFVPCLGISRGYRWLLRFRPARGSNSVRRERMVHGVLRRPPGKDQLTDASLIGSTDPRLIRPLDLRDRLGDTFPRVLPVMPRRPGQTRQLQRLSLRAGNRDQVSDEVVLGGQESDGSVLVRGAVGSCSLIACKSPIAFLTRAAPTPWRIGSGLADPHERNRPTQPGQHNEPSPNAISTSTGSSISVIITAAFTRQSGPA